MSEVTNTSRVVPDESFRCMKISATSVLLVQAMISAIRQRQVPRWLLAGQVGQGGEEEQRDPDREVGQRRVGALVVPVVGMKRLGRTTARSALAHVRLLRSGTAAG